MCDLVRDVSTDWAEDRICREESHSSALQLIKHVNFVSMPNAMSLILLFDLALTHLFDHIYKSKQEYV